MDKYTDKIIQNSTQNTLLNENQMSSLLKSWKQRANREEYCKNISKL